MTVNAGSRLDFVAFWLFGLASNFGFLTMLSAAEDIMGHGMSADRSANSTACEKEIDYRSCKVAPLGAVLLADILPAFVLKLTMPFYLDRIPFGVRHVFICCFQALAYLTVALSSSVPVALLGVVFASISDGVGDVTYLSLASHYPKHAVSSLISGTGAAGLLGSFLYATLTEPHLLNFSPRSTLLALTIGPCFLLASYFCLLTPSPTVHRVTISKPSTWLVPRKLRTLATIVPECGEDLKSAAVPYVHHEVLTFGEKLGIVASLLRYVVPLAITFYSEYLTVSTLTAFVAFNCQQGFELSRTSQYRWIQVVYRLGGLIGRSSVGFFQPPAFFLLLVPIIQTSNGLFFLLEALVHFVPHLSAAFLVLFFIGFIGGSNYANTFLRIHKEVHPTTATKEFCMSFCSLSDVLGILAAGASAIPIHNAICAHNRRLY